jgi:hypothetical protein
MQSETKPRRNADTDPAAVYDRDGQEETARLLGQDRTAKENLCKEDTTNIEGLSIVWNRLISEALWA